MKGKLKPCPFCGKKAEIFKDNYEHYMVICPCGVQVGVLIEDGCELIDGWRAAFETEMQAAKAWNRRADNGTL